MAETESLQQQVNEIQQQLTTLETARQSKTGLLFQYGLAPIVLLVLGFVFNSHLEKQKAQIQQLELANAMLPNLFSKEPSISMATQEILNNVLKDKELKAAIRAIAEKEIQGTMDNSSAKEREVILQKSKTFDPSIGKNLNKYQTALQFEHQGFEWLIKQEYEKAIAAFNQAKAAYPTFHQVDEIADYLDGQRATLINPATHQATRKAVIKHILDEMAWKAPKAPLATLKAELGNP